MAERAPVAQDKLAFLLSLVPYLLDNERVTVAQAARHFEVSEDQLRSAVSLIAVSGIPGDTGTYLHGDLFDIDWDAFEQDDEIVITHNVAIDYSPKFSATEAAALIAGLQYLSALPDNRDVGGKDALGGLMAKLALGASAAPYEVAVARGQTDAAVQQIRDAQSAGRQIQFDYLNAQGDSESRRVDPLRVESIDQDWYLRAWCHTREAVRTFRLDRMGQVVVSDDPITHHPGEVVLPDTLFQSTDADLVVTLELPASAMALIADYAPDSKGSGGRPGSKTAAGGPGGAEQRVRTTIRVAHYHGLVRLIAGLPGVVTVIAPPDARAAVADWAAAALSRYEEN